MSFSYMMKTFAAIVCVSVLNCAGGVPIQKQSKSSLPKRESVHRRSAASVEFLMNHDSHSTFTNENNDALSQSAIVSRQAFDNDLICWDEVFTGQNDPIHKRSSCPWYYENSHDSKRFPAAILTAKPLCPYAIGSSNTLECSPITQSITVLRQQDSTDESGNYVWLQDTETVVVGYTAAGRRTAQNSESQQTIQPTPDFAKR